MQVTNESIEELFGEERSRLLASLMSSLGDLDLAEDAMQDALLTALERWPKEGLPPNPIAWLVVTAKRKALNIIQRKTIYKGKLEVLKKDLMEESVYTDEHIGMEYPDERLKLIFTACHPALSLEAQIALTLNALGGLTTSEIAKAFLISKETMAQRLVRAKRKLKDAGIPFRIPPVQKLTERTDAVAAVIYLIFNEGYLASSGDSLIRSDLCHEAIRLGYLLVQLLEKENYSLLLPEAKGLLALMLFTNSRKAARLNEAGKLVLLEDQDRSKWDQDVIRDAIRLTNEAFDANRVGKYQIQAAIASIHATANSADETDWKRIASYYTLLNDLTPSPVVRLNHAVAVAMAEGPQQGLKLLTEIEQSGELKEYVPFYASYADLLRRVGEIEEALKAYKQALDLSHNDSERDFFNRRISELNV